MVHLSSSSSALTLVTATPTPAIADIPPSAQHTSTFSPPENQAAYNPSTSTIAVGCEASQPSSSTVAAQGQHLNQGLTPSAPQRSSSHSKLSSATTTSMPDSSATDPASVLKKGSKGSLKPKSRSGSVASSSSKKAAGPADTQHRGEAEVKSRRRGGFLSFLNCCSAPEDANEVELGEQAVPAKKAKVLQQKSKRQAIPLVNTTSNAGEAGKSESKKTAEDSIGGPEYSELRSAAKPKMITRSSKDKVPLDTGAATSGVAVKMAETPEQSPPTVPRDPPLPPLPPSTKESQQEPERREPSQPKTATAAVEPPQIMALEESVAVQGTTINDRTPTQEAQDSDVAMPDAPPLPTAREISSQSETKDLAQTQIALPPPPPHPPRNGQDRPVPSTSNATPNERQQWLLPPLQPQLQGRKCLVLDLDETLVHSSFKVRRFAFLFG